MAFPYDGRNLINFYGGFLLGLYQKAVIWIGVAAVLFLLGEIADKGAVLR